MLSLQEAREYSFDPGAEEVTRSLSGAVFLLPQLVLNGLQMYLVATENGTPFYTNDLLLARTTVGELSLFPLLIN